MYVSAWPVLNPRWFFERGRDDVPFPLNAPHLTYSYVARNLIYQLFRALRFEAGDTVLVPDYHHGNEVKAIRQAGATLRFYRINRRMEPDLDQLRRLLAGTPRPRALFLIHYLGWPQPVKEIQSLCRENDVLLIEDCAISMLSQCDDGPLGSFGDYAIFCLYKTLPIPNGGVMVSNRQPPLEGLASLVGRPGSAASVAGRTLDLLLAWVRSRSDPVGGALFKLKTGAGQALSAAGVDRVPVGDTGFNLDNVDLAMSSFCHSLLRRFDYANVVRRRRENFTLMLEMLEDRATPVPGSLLPGVCPLFFPILVADKPAAARALWSRGIDAVEFWNQGDPQADDPSSDARFLRDHVLELPIHQDVGRRQLRYMADQVGGLRLKF